MLFLYHILYVKSAVKNKILSAGGVLIGKVFNRGIPEFLTQLNTPVTAFCYNWVLLNTLGDMGVATFSILSFIYSFAYAILSGVAQGLQPLWGHAFGAKDDNLLKQYFNSGIKINFVTSALILIFLCIFDTQTVGIFTKDTELLNMTSKALPIFVLSFLFMAINLIFTAYFYSTKQTIKSDIIALSRGVVIKALLIFGIPYLFGVEYMWHSVLAAEIITLGICLICKVSKINTV